MLVYCNFFIFLYGFGVLLYLIIFVNSLRFRFGFWVFGVREEFDWEDGDDEGERGLSVEDEIRYFCEVWDLELGFVRW